MILKMIVGGLFFLMTLMLGFFMGKEAGRKEANEDK